MKTGRVHKITKLWLAIVMIMALLPCVGIAQDAAGPDEQLIEAAKKGDFDKVKSLLEEGANVNAKNDDGQTALMAAASGKNPEIVKFLTEKGADVNARTESGRTVLMAALCGGNLDVVKFLIDKGADIKARDKNGWTVLMPAAAMGKLDAGKLLIDNGADVNAQDTLGWTALIWAADQGKLEIVKLLIEKRADVNAQENTCLDRLSAFLESIARTLKDGDPSHLVRGPGRTALEIAQEEGHKEIVEYLKTGQVYS